MLTLVLIVSTLLCALLAIRTQQLLHAALWLAGASALTSLVMYSLGLPQAAVIELSVGAGLVFILFVFAISLAPTAARAANALVPAPLAITGVGLVLLLFGELAWPHLASQPAVSVATLGAVLWEDRQLDLLVLIALIFAGALTVAGLLAPEIEPRTAPAARAPVEIKRAQPKTPGLAPRLPEYVSPTRTVATPDRAPTQERVV